MYDYPYGPPNPSYGGYGGYGGYGSGWPHQHLGDAHDDGQYQPSRALREVLVERIDEQIQYLDDAATRLEELKEIAERGAASEGKGAGDIQISGQSIESVRPHVPEPDLLANHASMMSAYGLPSNRKLLSYMQKIRHNPPSEDPIVKYTALKHEMMYLIELSEPRKAPLSTLEYNTRDFERKDFDKELDEALETILGPPKGNTSKVRQGPH